MFGRLKRTRQRSDSGLTLVELAVAVLILSLGTVAALRATDQSRIAIGGAQDRLLAQLVAQNRAETLQFLDPAQTDALPGTVMMAGQQFTVNTTTKQTAAGLIEATVSARAERGPGAVYVIYLAPGRAP